MAAFLFLMTCVDTICTSKRRKRWVLTGLGSFCAKEAYPPIEDQEAKVRGRSCALTSRDFVSSHHLDHDHLLPPFFHYCSARRLECTRSHTSSPLYHILIIHNHHDDARSICRPETAASHVQTPRILLCTTKSPVARPGTAQMERIARSVIATRASTSETKRLEDLTASQGANTATCHLRRPLDCSKRPYLSAGCR
jgi:hypothetical protein